MIKVLHYGLGRNRGGIETYLSKIYHDINREEFAFDFVDEWNGEVCFRKEFEELGARFFNVTQRRESYVKNKKDWEKAIAKSEPDIVHCHMNTLSYITPIVEFKKNGKAKIIVHSRSAGTVTRKTTRILHYINQRRIKDYDITRVAVSDIAGAWLFGKDSDYFVINNGIDINRFHYDEKIRRECRKALNFGDNEIIIGNVGALYEPKNQIFLIEIFNEILKIDNRARLIILGDGIERINLENKIHQYGLDGKVKMPGNKKDVERYLNAFDLYVMPSTFEGFPNALLEAQACGLPCVASDVITKEVNIGNCIYVSLEQNTSKWARLAMDYYNSHTRCNGSDLVLTHGLSVADEINRVENLYRDIMKKDF